MQISACLFYEYMLHSIELVWEILQHLLYVDDISWGIIISKKLRRNTFEKEGPYFLWSYTDYVYNENSWEYSLPG